MKKLIAYFMLLSIVLTVTPAQSVYAEYQKPYFTGNYRIVNEDSPQNVPPNTVVSQELGTVDDSSGKIIYYYSLIMPGDGICNIEISRGGNYNYGYTIIKFDDPKIEIVNGIHEKYVDVGETFTISPELKKGTYTFYVSAELIPELHKSEYTSNFKFHWSYEGSGSVDVAPQPTPTPTPTPTPIPTTPPTLTESNLGGFDLEAIAVGVKLKWNSLSGGLGYRLYRSERSGVEGISVTDFYIKSNQFVDVNIDADKTYYYTVRKVLAEARPTEGIPEKLGSPSSQIKVTTGSQILGGNSSEKRKKFILMKLNDPMMNADGIPEEIDPGRGTTPIIYSSRTLVPIRAIVEKMKGTVDWDAATQKITLKNAGKTVEMWLENKTITVNGINSQIDVAPKSINDRTMVPIRFAAENLGCQVDWINSTQEIVIVYMSE